MNLKSSVQSHEQIRKCKISVPEPVVWVRSDRSYKAGLRVLVCTSAVQFLHLRTEEKQSNSSYNELKMTGSANICEYFSKIPEKCPPKE